MKKKAQVTIYIILGLVLLIAVGMLFFLETEKIEKAVETEIPGEVEYAGQQELRNFMDACIREAAFNGIEIIRLQAGYIDIPADTPTVTVKNGKRIVVQDGLKKVVDDPEGENEAAYWLDSENRLFVPTENYIANNLADYIKKSVLLCTDDFSAFKEENYAIAAGDLNVDVEFSDEVLVKIDYPISFERGDIKFEEKEFILRVPVGLGKAIDIAADIVVNEYIGNFLEYDIKYLLALYSYAGADVAKYDPGFRTSISFSGDIGDPKSGLPPLSFTMANMNCKMATWELDEVEEMLKDNFAANFQYIAVEGYDSKAPSADNDIARGVYKGFTHDIVNERYEDTEIDFIFDRDGDMFVDVKPRSGDTLKPHRHTATGIKFLPLFCTLRYQFKYTLKFPVFAKVIDTKGYAIDVPGRTVDKENNFEFSVPIGVFLCGNQNRKCTGKPAYASQEISLEDFNFDELNITLPVETMFCDEDMKLSQPMKIRTIDAYTFQPVTDATVFYRCGSFENECVVDISDDEGFVETRMPLCVNGQLYVIKDDYSQSVTPLTTEQGSALKQIDYILEPLKELEVEVKLVELPALMGNYYLSQGFSSHRCTGESIGINDASLAARDVLEKNVMISSNYGPSNVALVYPEGKNLKLASGEYSFSYLVEGEVVIQPYTYGGETLSLNKDGSPYKGSYLFGSYNGLNAEFPIDQIKAAKKIVFYVPVETTSSAIDIIGMGNIIQADGSLYKKGLVDDDCNAATPDKEVEIMISKEEISRILKPRLE